MKEYFSNLKRLSMVLNNLQYLHRMRNVMFFFFCNIRFSRQGLTVEQKGVIKKTNLLGACCPADRTKNIDNNKTFYCQYNTKNGINLSLTPM